MNARDTKADNKRRLGVNPSREFREFVLANSGTRNLIVPSFTRRSRCDYASDETMLRKQQFSAARIIAVIIIMSISSSIVAAANNPGHDTLYILKVGDNMTGSLNLTGNLTAYGVQTATFLYGSGLDIWANGTTQQAVSSKPTIQAAGTNLFIDNPLAGDLRFNTIAGTSNFVRFGTGAIGVVVNGTLNVVNHTYVNGTIRIYSNGSGSFTAGTTVDGSAVCTSANGLCSGGATGFTQWRLGSNTGTIAAITNNTLVNITAGTGISTTLSGSTITIASTVTDTNSGGNITGSGAANTIPLWRNGTHINNSIITQTGISTVNINGNISTPTNFWIGNGAAASGAGSTAMGEGANAMGAYSFAAGWYSLAGTTDGSMAFGPSTTANGTYSMALGGGATVNGTGAIGIGYAKVNGPYAIAIGDSTNVSHANSVAIGHYAMSTAANQLVIGNVSAGAQLNTRIYGTLNVSGTINSSTDVCITGGNCLSAMGTGSGDITDVLQGTGLIVTNGGGPQPTVALNTTYTGTLYLGISATATNSNQLGGQTSGYYLNITGFNAANLTSGTIPSARIPDSYLLNTGDTGAGNYTFDTTTLHIDSTNDKIGIGTTTPNEKLEVVGDLRMETDSGYGDILFTDGAALGANRYSGQVSLLASMKGRLVNYNPDFSQNTIQYTAYDNNAAAPNPVHTIVSDSTSPSSSGKILNISYDGTGTPGTNPTPGYGGFHLGLTKCTAEANTDCYVEGNRYLYRVWARIPTDKYLVFTTNACGTGCSNKWISPTNGTGTWEEYILLQKIGEGGTLSSTAFFYILGGANSAFDWQVASVEVIGLDEPATVDQTKSLNVGYKQNITVGQGNLVSTGATYLATDSGNVGIGTTAPTQKLEVNGSINASEVYVGGAGLKVCRSDGTNCPSISGSSSAGGWQNSTGLVQLATATNNISAGALAVDNINGRVGLGTTTPGAKVDIAVGDGGSAIYISNTSGTPRFAINTIAGGAWTMYDYQGSSWNSGITQKSGNVGIGTVSPTSKLDVTGQNITLTGANGLNTSLNIFDFSGPVAGFRIVYEDATGATYLQSTYDNAAGDIYFQTKTSGTPVNAMMIESAGLVGIGTTAPLGNAGDLTLGNVAGTQGALYLYGSTAGAYSRIMTTDGNLHIDAYSTSGTYLNYFTGSGGTIFGNGAGGLSGASVSSAGVITATSFTGAGTGLTGTAASLTAGAASVATNANACSNDGTCDMSTAAANYYDVTAGNGYGLRFWSSDTYKIHMGTGSEYQYGPVNDYSIKTNMNNQAGRGWTWGIAGSAPIAAIEATTGNAQFAGSVVSSTYASDKTGKLARNLLDTNIWTISNDSIGGWSANNGVAGETQRVWDTDPFGRVAIVMKDVSDGANDPSGGWNYYNIPIDNNKSYRTSVWVKRVDSTAGSIYLGCDSSNTNNLDGSANGNPYFFAFPASTLTVGRWYLLVGYIHAANDPSMTSYSAVYDGVTGQKVLSGTDYKNRAANNYQTQRVYSYYNTAAGTSMLQWGPRFEQMDGSEPPIESLLGTPQSATLDRQAYFGGNVGIGTTAPVRTLDVRGNVLVQNNSGVTNVRIGNNSRSYSFIQHDDNAQNTRVGSYNGTDYVLYKIEGNPVQIFTTVSTVLTPTLTVNNNTVGIGTQTPSYKLEVNSTGPVAKFGSTSTNSIELRTDDLATGFWIRNDGANPVISTKIGDLYYGYQGRTGMAHRFYNGSTGYQAMGIGGTGLITIGSGTPGNASGAGDLYVTSDIELDGTFYGSGSDLAEMIHSDDATIQPGTVVELIPGKNTTVRKSTTPYSKTVAGIVTTRPSLLIGTENNGTALAISGRVPVRANSENGPISVGDLLTTSSTPGEAMKCDDPALCFGAILGKATEDLRDDHGTITALVVLG